MTDSEFTQVVMDLTDWMHPEAPEVIDDGSEVIMLCPLCGSTRIAPTSPCCPVCGKPIIWKPLKEWMQ